MVSDVTNSLFGALAGVMLKDGGKPLLPSCQIVQWIFRTTDPKNLHMALATHWSWDSSYRRRHCPQVDSGSRAMCFPHRHKAQESIPSTTKKGQSNTVILFSLRNSSMYVCTYIHVYIYVYTYTCIWVIYVCMSVYNIVYMHNVYIYNIHNILKQSSQS